MTPRPRLEHVTVTNEERRWAAGQLRLREDAPERIGNLNSIVTKITHVPSKDWRGQLGVLADLIDRPTCKDVGDDVFVCSRCKWQGLIHECGTNGAGEPFARVIKRRYHCPYCGADITE